GTAPVTAIGNIFRRVGDAQPLSNFAIEDEIVHAMDGNGGGLVTWVADSVFVTNAVGSIQRGVDVVLAGGTVYVQDGTYAAYNVASKVLIIRFASGTTLSQQTDPVAAGALTLSITGTAGNDSITFSPKGKTAIDVGINSLPTATFAPTGRLIAHGGAGD